MMRGLSTKSKLRFEAASFNGAATTTTLLSEKAGVFETNELEDTHLETKI